MREIHKVGEVVIVRGPEEEFLITPTKVSGKGFITGPVTAVRVFEMAVFSQYPWRWSDA